MKQKPKAAGIIAGVCCFIIFYGNESKINTEKINKK